MYPQFPNNNLVQVGVKHIITLDISVYRVLLAINFVKNYALLEKPKYKIIFYNY